MTCFDGCLKAVTDLFKSKNNEVVVKVTVEKLKKWSADHPESMFEALMPSSLGVFGYFGLSRF